MEAWFRSVLEGRRKSIVAVFLRRLLFPAGCLFGCVAALRAWSYQRRLRATHHAEVPVISVGNITVGGTGKTPFVIYICKLLIDAGEHPAILTRGYGATTPEEADEPQIFARHLPDVKVIVNADRVTGAAQAVQTGATVLVLDDGFQHLRLARDLNLVLLDTTHPFGNGQPLPAGLLREFKSALRRASALCFTRHPQLENSLSASSKNPAAEFFSVIPPEVKNDPLLSSLPKFSAAHIATGLLSLAETKHDLDFLRNLRVIAVSGIARPDAFHQTLRLHGAKIEKSFDFPDHHVYTEIDLRTLKLAAVTHSATLITTEKDAVKLRSIIAPEDQDETLVLAVGIRVVDADQFRELVLGVVRD